jgi:hypothetical protein
MITKIFRYFLQTMLSSTAYYSDLVAAVFSTGSICTWWLTHDAFASGIDIISVAIILNACSTLVEFFADVSMYRIFKESANF